MVAAGLGIVFVDGVATMILSSNRCRGFASSLGGLALFVADIIFSIYFHVKSAGILFFRLRALLL